MGPSSIAPRGPAELSSDGCVLARRRDCRRRRPRTSGVCHPFLVAHRRLVCSGHRLWTAGFPRILHAHLRARLDNVGCLRSRHLRERRLVRPAVHRLSRSGGRGTARSPFVVDCRRRRGRRTRVRNRALGTRRFRAFLRIFISSNKPQPPAPAFVGRLARRARKGTPQAHHARRDVHERRAEMLLLGSLRGKAEIAVWCCCSA